MGNIGNKTYLLGLSIGFAVSLVALIKSYLSPKTNSTSFYLSNTEHIDPGMVKIVNMIGGDLLSLVPKDVQKKSIANKEVDDAFKHSGNPWGVTKLEFLTLRATYGFLGLSFGALFSFLAGVDLLLGTVITVMLGLLGWNYPVSAYKKVAEKRAADFKKHFPEMLDYLTMILKKGNYTFSNALEEVLPYLEESAVKEEFTKVTNSINTGMSEEAALNELAKRLPSQALEAFVNSVNNARRLSTPMDDLMRTQAKKTREDLINELELLIQTIPNKTLLTVAPITIFSLIVIFMVPLLISLASSL